MAGSSLPDIDDSNGLTPLQVLLNGRHLPALDGIRALAVFTVIAYHSGLGVPGDLGVSGFFVLSGFLITWLLAREWDETGSVSLRRFYARRTLRIFPAYYVFLAFSIAIDLYRGDQRIRPAILPGLTYLVNYYNALHGHPTNSIAHAWSLAVEEQFYLVWPALFLYFSVRGGRARMRGLLVLIVTVLVWRSALYLSGLAGPAYVYNAFDTRFDNLAIGCVLALAARESWFQRPAIWFARAAWMPLGTVALLIVSRLGLGVSWHYSAGFSIDAALLGLLILQLLQLHGSRWWRWIDHPITRYLGQISYPLYLYHLWGIGLGKRVGGSGFGGLLVGVVFAVLLASGSYFFVERPFLRLKRRFQAIDAG